MEKTQDQPLDLKGAYTILKQWYRHALEIQPKTSKADLAKVPYPLRRPIPIQDRVPLEAEVEVAV